MPTYPNALATISVGFVEEISLGSAVSFLWDFVNPQRIQQRSKSSMIREVVAMGGEVSELFHPNYIFVGSLLPHGAG